MKKRLAQWSAFIVGVAWISVAGAQGLVDPTRPPGGLAGSVDAVVALGPVLQTVMLSPSRKVAVISGEVVALGGSYGGARLVKLTESEAVLKNGAETTVLRLYPMVEKRVTDSTQGSSRKNAEKTTK